ncbi:MAG: ATP-binding cassette domain-containing protein [Candidatus Odinarchaeota archaeon]
MGITKRAIFAVIIMISIVMIQIIALLYINTPPDPVIPEEESVELTSGLLSSTKEYLNPNTGIFIEPQLEANYWIARSKTLLPIKNQSNTELQLLEELFISNTFNRSLKEYYWSKQNMDGGFAEIAGGSDLESTYRVLSIINQTNPSLLDDSNSKHNDIETFTETCLQHDNQGFVINPYVSIPATIKATFYGISILNWLTSDLLTNEFEQNVTSWLEYSWTGTGYADSPFHLSLGAPATIEATYYVFKIYQLFGLSFDAIKINTIIAYLTACRTSNGGFSQYPTGPSSLMASYFASLLLNGLEQPIPQSIDLVDFTLSCNNTHGGFIDHPDNHTLIESEMSFSCAALKILDLLAIDLPTSVNNEFSTWLCSHHTKTGLFGYPTLEANYYGLLSLVYGVQNGAIQALDPVNPSEIQSFIDSTYNDRDGGYKTSLLDYSDNSTLYATFCALETMKMLKGLNDNVFADDLQEKQNITAFVVKHFNEETGGYCLTDKRFSLDLDQIGSLNYVNQVLQPYFRIFGVYSGFYNFTRVIEYKQPTMINTWLALNCLNDLNVTESVNDELTAKWVKSGQLSNGGFHLANGFPADIASSYFAWDCLRLLDETPYSTLSLIEFTRNSQVDDGGFTLNPSLALVANESIGSLIKLTFFATELLYSYNVEPDQPDDLVTYYTETIIQREDENIYTVADFPGFGPDIRNQAYGLAMITYIQQDVNYNPDRWNIILLGIFAVEIAFAVLYILTFQVFTIIRSRSGKHLSDKYADIIKHETAISARNLSVFAGKRRIISQCSIDLLNGEILGILGESGSGKSTFVKALLGLRRFKGEIFLYGLNMKRKKDRQKTSRIYGYVPQDLSKIYLHLSIMDNLLTFGRQYGLGEDLIIERGRKILKSLEIEDKSDSLVSNLSGGQQRRASIAIALIHNPTLCILDEPTSGLDPVVRQSLWLSLVNLNEIMGTTFIIITHYPEEARYCNKIAIFGRGRGLVDYGTPEELLTQLPGQGRALQLHLKVPVPESRVFLQLLTEKQQAKEEAFVVLEIKSNHHFLIFSNLSVSEIDSLLANEESPLKGKIQKISQVDAQMEHFFRFRMLEVGNFE